MRKLDRAGRGLERESEKERERERESEGYRDEKLESRD